MDGLRTCFVPYCLVYLLTKSYPTAIGQKDVVVTTSYGRLRGSRIEKDFKLGTDVVSNVTDVFLGIPYAEPPIGDLRFQPPQKPAPWRHIRSASKLSSVCPQLIFHPDTKLENQNEDCLFLNIYSPFEISKPNASYPVMVYFHGGSFEVGTGRSYDGSVLTRFGVVVVTINYRLGVLGFLSTGDSMLPGNYGLLDQVETLKWIRDNISPFRGDPTRVTIFGHSVGAASVGLMMILPKAQGLFHSVIAQSGVATAIYSSHHRNKTDFNVYCQRVGKIFGCNDKKLSGVVSCLRKVPAQEFIETRGQFPMYDPIDPEFRPFVDGDVITDLPKKLFDLGRFSRVPIMLGTVKDEFVNYFNGGARYSESFDKALDDYLAKLVGHNPTIIDLVRFQYTDWSGHRINSTDGQFEYRRGDLLSDMHIIAPTIEMADSISDHSQNIYQYHFSANDSYHSVELNYVFGSPFSGQYADEMNSSENIKQFSQEELSLSLKMMRLWTNFAKHGRPLEESITWSPYKRKDSNYLLLSATEIAMKRHLRAEQVAFWNQVVPLQLKSSHATGIVLASTGGGMAHATQVNVWVLLACVGVLLGVIFLLTAVLIKTVVEKKRFQDASTLYATRHIV